MTTQQTTQQTPPRVAVIYYSGGGTVHQLAEAIAQGARDAGADVRLRRVAETAPAEVIQGNPAWAKHAADTAHVPVATHDDLLWADGLAFGTPTRFGTPSAQLKQFIDTTGPLWAQGAFDGKAVTAFTAAENAHGGQEATLLSLAQVFCHWGAVHVPPGYTDQTIFAAGGNPYGISVKRPETGALDAATVAAARYQGRRLARFALACRAARAAGNDAHIGAAA